MKKIFLLSYIYLIALFIQPLNAQVKIGVQAGINLTDVNMDLTQEGFKTAIRTRTILGGILSYNFSPVMGLQAEPAYVQKGSAVEAAIDFSNIINGATLNAEGTIAANYFDIPVLLKASLPYGPIRPYILAGGSIAILLGDAKIRVDKATINGQDVIGLIPIDEREQTYKLKSTDFILSFGGGITIPAGLLSVFIEGRYDLGLTDLSEGPHDFGIAGVNYDAEFKTRGIQLKAGLLFSL